MYKNILKEEQNSTMLEYNIKVRWNYGMDIANSQK